MSEGKPTTPSQEETRRPVIQKPPSREELDQVSREQGMLTDEWADQEAAREK